MGDLHRLGQYQLRINRKSCLVLRNMNVALEQAEHFFEAVRRLHFLEVGVNLLGLE